MAERRVLAVATGRADFGLLTSPVRACRDHPSLDAAFVLTGAYSTAGGETDPEAGGWPVAARVPTLDAADDRPGAMGRAIARGVAGFTEVLAVERPDAVMLLGDRFETLAAAVASSSSGVPIVHVHGGEISTGAVDNQFRYAVTALASLHCVATERSRDRLIAMGEAPAAVVRTGAPGLDGLRDAQPMDRAAFAAAAGMPADGRFLLVTLHSETLGEGDSGEQARALVAALDRVGLPCLVTASNQDPGGIAINAVLREACAERGWAFREALGLELYRAAMAAASAMVGNSSSGIIEAASFGLPVVNIGDRQAGRERSGNVVDCAHGEGAIEAAVRAALAMDASGIANVYGDGGADERIADAIASMPLGAAALRKQFEPPALGGSSHGM